MSTAHGASPQATPLLEMEGVSKRFGNPARLFRRLSGGDPGVRALDDVSLDISEGESLGLVGESGSGKTTLGRCIAGVFDPSSGAITYRGHPISASVLQRDRELRREIQMVFQDPSASLNPRHRVATILEEPLKTHGLGDAVGRRERLRALLDSVGLAEDSLHRFPHEFSGGQRQRIAIARALAVEPRLVVCDEVVSALDVSVQGQIINLLQELRQQHGLTYLFISHDMAVVRHVADRVAVMYAGRIVELGPSSRVFAAPAHPYTRLLLASVPKGVPGVGRTVARTGGQDTSHNRVYCTCGESSRKGYEATERHVPALKEVAPGHLVACHCALETTDLSRSGAAD